MCAQNVFNYSEFPLLSSLAEQAKSIKGTALLFTKKIILHCVPFCLSYVFVGEIEAARVKNVHLYVAQKIKAQSKKKKSKLHQSTRTGLLIITNFRLSFVAFESDDKHDKSKKNATFQENILLGLYDITLSNIDEIYAYTDKKQRLVLPSQKNASKIDAIRIVCKNFRMLTFTFEDAEVGKGKYIADALLKFAFPARHSLLFMYQYK